MRCMNQLNHSTVLTSLILCLEWSHAMCSVRATYHNFETGSGQWPLRPTSSYWDNLEVIIWVIYFQNSINYKLHICLFNENTYIVLTKYKQEHSYFWFNAFCGVDFLKIISVTLVCHFPSKWKSFDWKHTLNIRKIKIHDLNQAKKKKKRHWNQLSF